MMKDEHQRAIEYFRDFDVTRAGYVPVPEGFHLVEGYDAEMAEIQDRIARIIYGLIVGARTPWEPNQLAAGISILLAEHGFTDAAWDGPRLEVKRDA